MSNFGVVLKDRAGDTIEVLGFSASYPAAGFYHFLLRNWCYRGIVVLTLIIL